MRAEAGAGEDDVPGDGEAVEVDALLDAEANSGPEAVLGVGGENADLLDVAVAAAIDPRVAGEEELGGEVLGPVAEEMARGEAELQAGEAAAGADLQLVVRVGHVAQGPAELAEGRELVAAFEAHDHARRSRVVVAEASAGEVHFVGQRQRGRENEQEG